MKKSISGYKKETYWKVHKQSGLQASQNEEYILSNKGIWDSLGYIKLFLLLQLYKIVKIFLRW